MRCSFLEIYNEDIRDLLRQDEKKLEMREDQQKNVYVQDLSIIPVKSISEINLHLHKGTLKRKTA